MPAVEAINVHKSYMLGSTAVGAVRGIDLTVEQGEFVAIMGPSGCGKTTLLNLMGAIDRPSRGSVLLEGVDLAGLSEDALSDLRRDRIGFVFQFYNLLPTLTAAENITLPLALRGVRRAESDARAQDLLEKIGLRDRADHQPAELSGGEQQRVAIARALANRPAIVLLDEPTGDLDTATGREVMALLTRINREDAVTVLVATHDASVSVEADRILHLRDGKIEREEANP